MGDKGQKGTFVHKYQTSARQQIKTGKDLVKL